MEKEAVNEVLKDTIKYSNKEIKRSKKKAFVISMITVLIITTVFILFNIYNKSKYDNDIKKAGDKFSKYERAIPFKIASIEKEDGWVCRFEIHYYKKNENNYIYTCFNIKYKEVAGFNYYHYNSDNDKYYISDETYPGYIHNNDYYKEILKIEDYFNEKQFDKTIIMNELNGLELEKIDKKDVLELFNRAINSKLIDRYGNYPNAVANIYNYEYVSYDTGNVYVVGYYIDSPGYIRNVYLDLKYHNSYATDLVKENKVLPEDIEVYNILQKVEQYIIENQIFDLPSSLKNNKYCNELKKYNFHVINQLINNSDGYLGRYYRYVENLDEMKNQTVESKIR